LSVIREFWNTHRKMNRDSNIIKICFIAPKAYPLFNSDIKEPFGGAELDLYFLTTELAKDKGFAVSFITADYGQQDIEIIEDVTVIKSLNFKKNALVGAVKVWRSLRKADATMYMIKTISAGMFLVALFCRLKGKIFLYRTSNTNSCDGTYLRQKPLFGRIYKWALRKAGHVFVQNKTDRDNLLRTTGVVATAISNGHRLSELHHGLRDTILWVGRSVEIKKPMLFIELAEKVPSENFTMICSRATGDKKYENLLARTKQVENLTFIERVRFDEIYSFYQRAKVFVNTSDAEGFPNTFIQACQFGVPILSLNVNPDGFLDEYGCGISCEGDFKRFKNSLDFMLSENRYIEMGKKGRAYVEQNHDIKKIIEEYKKIFHQLYG
jgi:glycosyltransferase involved in cell wall biosynthesis